VLAPQLLYPVPTAQIDEWLHKVQTVAVVELNFASQLYRYLRGYVDLPVDALRLSRAGGTPLTLIELLSFAVDNVPLPADFNHARIRHVLEGGQL
jgi:pyruvate/2-oxoacid:ferredoxin oxidoreductase alpha subunit